MGLRILIVIFLFVYLSTDCFGQNKTEIRIAAIDNPALTIKMEKAATLLINEINDAFYSNRVPKNTYENIINTKAFESLLSLWEVSHFRITETQLVLDGLNLFKGGFQIRNIPVFIKEAKSPNQGREIAITFDKEGKIDDLFLCLEMNMSDPLLHDTNSVTDFRRRQVILDFVEKFRTAYNTKDIDFINKIYSENALIIVGKIIKESPTQMDMMKSSSIPGEKVKYVKLSKSEYVNNLSKAFKRNEYVNIDFDSIEVTKHKVYPEIYGVTLWQKWNSSTYSDLGWLFLMIDFKNDELPQIHVRTWQPGVLNGNFVSKNEVFQLGDFKIANH